MLQRWITNRLNKSISRNPAVALLGARQAGKTTLAKAIAKDIDIESIYLDLERPQDLAKLKDATSFFELHRDKLIILDEIQRTPDLFMILRGMIDLNRERGRKSTQFLLLGSASMDLLRQSSESLAGRISYIEMPGINILEAGENNIKKLWLRGGFPESYLADSDEESMEWLHDLIHTYIERDVPQIGFSASSQTLFRLWTMLAHTQGETVNASKLATNLEISRRDVNSYIDILADLLLLRRIEPWHINVKKRLVKSPRYYVRDSGILHRLLEINDYHSLLSNPVLGKSWEGFVVENIYSVLPRLAKAYYYRTSAGAEIDLVIKMPNREIWAIEIKYGTAPKLSKHYSTTCDDVYATHKFIVYGGDDEFPVGNGVSMISLARLMERITAI